MHPNDEMATLLVGTAFVGLTAMFVRGSLKQAAQNGRVLGPLAARFAGLPAGPAGATGQLSGNWTVGGFQQKMDKSEATQILGLKCAGFLVAAFAV
jgi:hypothetical protein